MTLLNAVPQANVRPYQPYTVEVRVTNQITYSVEARTPEQAEAIVEELIAEGEVGAIDSTSVEVLEVYADDSDATGFV